MGVVSDIQLLRSNAEFGGYFCNRSVECLRVGTRLTTKGLESMRVPDAIRRDYLVVVAFTFVNVESVIPKYPQTPVHFWTKHSRAGEFRCFTLFHMVIGYVGYRSEPSRVPLTKVLFRITLDICFHKVQDVCGSSIGNITEFLVPNRISVVFVQAREVLDCVGNASGGSGIAVKVPQSGVEGVISQAINEPFLCRGEVYPLVGHIAPEVTGRPQSATVTHRPGSSSTSLRGAVCGPAPSSTGEAGKVGLPHQRSLPRGPLLNH